jgi:hypothetical protein
MNYIYYIVMGKFLYVDSFVVFIYKVTPKNQ